MVTIPDLDDDVIARVQLRATLNGHTLEDELREIVTRALRPLTPDVRVGLAHEAAARTSPLHQTDSVTPLRESREQWHRKQERPARGEDGE